MIPDTSKGNLKYENHACIMFYWILKRVLFKLNFHIYMNHFQIYCQRYLQPLGLHYNHYMSLFVCYQLVKMFIAIEPLTSNCFALCTNMKIYLYNCPKWVEPSMHIHGFAYIFNLQTEQD